MFKEDLELNNQQWLVCHKTTPDQNKSRRNSFILKKKKKKQPVCCLSKILRFTMFYRTQSFRFRLSTIFFKASNMKDLF